MAHETFEHEATAALMNELFVNVKVDREERPDVDAVYMEAVQAIAGQGGWPMTVFLTPDGRPFFGGTYFPRDRFAELLRQVDAAWTGQRQALERDADQLADAIRAGTRLERPPAAGETALAASLLEGGYQALQKAYDPEWGGFGRAPKFPQPTMVELVLRLGARVGDTDALAMVATHARRHGRGRHLRPPGRRFRPLLGRAHLARPPLREDALRQRPARCASTSTPGRSPASSATARSWRRRRPTCSAPR